MTQDVIRSRVLHRTYYNYSNPVLLGPHTMRLRPREGHDLRILSSQLQLQPCGHLRWYRDALDNCVCVATFDVPTQQLSITSDVTVEHYPGGPGTTAWTADRLPAGDSADELAILAPYRKASGDTGSVATILPPPSGLPTMQRLAELGDRIRTGLRYTVRMEAGVQAPDRTLALGTGSCRDLAALFIEAARHLGVPARFVSGYLRTEGSGPDHGATHAWAEAYVAGHGWTGFDPTAIGAVGPDHIAVSVAREPGTVPPVSGSFTGAAQASLDVGVWVTRIPGATDQPPCVK